MVGKVWWKKGPLAWASLLIYIRICCLVNYSSKKKKSLHTDNEMSPWLFTMTWAFSDIIPAKWRVNVPELVFLSMSFITDIPGANEENLPRSRAPW